jgi:enterochelin esterase-like enzyme
MYLLVLLATPSAFSPGDGTYSVGPDYHVDPVLKDAATHKPEGHYYQFILPIKGSKFYDCTDATNSTPFHGYTCLPYRNISVYVPSAYKDSDEVAVLVTQDGPGYDPLLVPIMDGLINHPDETRSLPVFIAISVSTGTISDGIGSLRDNQYDTVSGKYAEFVNDEIFAAVRTHLSSDFPKLNITTNPDGRLTMGCSSGGAAAFEMAWWRPDLFRRVIAYSAFIVFKDSTLPSNLTHPFGAWEFPELIKASPKKLLRIFHSVTNRDICTTVAQGLVPYPACEIDFTTGKQTEVPAATAGCFTYPGICQGTPGEGRLAYSGTPCTDPKHSNTVLANNATAAALEEKGYETRFAYALSVCHCDPVVFFADLPNTLVWAWRGWE